MKPDPPPALRFLRGALEQLSADSLLRDRPAPLAPGALSFCSNDYLGLAATALPVGEAPAGAGASRLVSGERDEHRELERTAADLVGAESALAFTSGYAANAGVLPALAQPDDVVVSDALNHASIIDGARLSRARVVVVPHLDVEAIRRALRTSRRGRAWIVVESYYSMDADSPDLRALREVADGAGAALIVDEAHALGVFGPDGRGLCAGAGVAPDVLIGTFGKSFGAAGAFVAGCDELVRWLWNRARTFVFSTGVSPAVAHAAACAIRASLADPQPRAAVLAAAARLRTGLARLDLDVRGYGPIVPWVIGPSQRALEMAAFLRERGVHVHPIRPPSVPVDTARLRLTVTARHTAADVDRALDAVQEAIRCVPA